MKKLILLVSLSTTTLFASSSLKEHVHGEAKLSLTTQGKTIAIEIESPAESILGYEHAPNNKAEKANWETIKSDFLTSRHVSFSKGLICKLDKFKSKVELEEVGEEHHDDHHDEKHDKHKGEHREVHIALNYLCEDNLSGNWMEVKLGAGFNKMHKLHAEILIEGKTPERLTIKSPIHRIEF